MVLKTAHPLSKLTLPIAIVFCLACFGKFAKADLATTWDVGEQPDDFTAFRIDSTTGTAEAVNLYGESGADVYVISTCAMWCTPCQLFAEDSQAIVQEMANEGIDVGIYDFIFQDTQFNEADAADAQAWIDFIWTADPENVWFGGAIPESSTDSVTIQIFNAFLNQNGGNPAIPSIVILDRNLTVRELRAGYTSGSLSDSIRAAAVPEPTASCFVGALFIVVFLFYRRRSKFATASRFPAEGPGAQDTSDCFLGRRKGLVVFVVSVAILFAQSANGQSRTDTISKSGDLAPHGNGTISSFFRSLNEPLQLNNIGDVAFTANLSGTNNGPVDDLAILFGNENSIETVVVEGQASPSGNGTVDMAFFSGTGSLVPRNRLLNDSGELVFSTRFAGTNGGISDSRGLVKFDGSGLVETVRSGQTPLGSPFPFAGNSDFAATINNNAVVGFHGVTSQGAINRAGLYVDAGNGIQQIVEDGNSVPGTFAGPSGGQFGAFADFTLNDTDAFAFVGFISNSNSNTGVFVGDANGLRGVARVGTPISNGQLIGQISSGAIANGLNMKFNNAGQVAFHGLANGRSTIMTGDGLSVVEVVAQQNQLLGSLGTIKNIHHFELNDAGQLALSLAFDGTFDTNVTDSIVRQTSGTFSRMVQLGDTVHGSTVTELDRDIHLNNSGVIAYSARLNSSVDDQGFFVTDGIDTVKAVRIGDALEESLVTQLTTIRNAGFNENGQLAYHAVLANGQEVISKWTPNLQYRASSDGDWDDSNNWTLSLTPDQVHDVSINSDSNLIVTGPVGSSNVRSLQIGDGLGQSVLNLQSSSLLSSTNDVVIASNGLLTGNGTLVGNVENSGVISGELTINGEVNETSNGQIRIGNEHLVINGNLNAINPISMTGGQVTINGDAVFNNELASITTGTLELNGLINGTSEIRTQQTTFAISSLELGGNADSVFQFDANGFDSWFVGGNLQRNGALTIQSDGGFAGLDFNETFQITNALGSSSGQYTGLSEGAFVGSFDGVDIFISYLGGSGDDTILTTEQVPQWSGGNGNWHNASRWINGLPNAGSRMVLLDKDPEVNSFVSTAGQDTQIQNLRIDAGDTLFVERGSNGQGRLTFDSTPSGALSSRLLNNGTIEIGSNNSVHFETDLEISGTGVLNLQATTTNLRQLGNDLRLVNGTAQTIQGQGRIEARFLDNLGMIDANVATGSLTNLTIAGQFAGSNAGFREGVLNNQGTIRASNGGGALVDIRETDGGVFEASGTGSRIHFSANKFTENPATVIRNALFRTSDGGIISASTDRERVLFLDNVTNTGHFQARNVRLFNSLNNIGRFQLLNSADENISLGNHLTISGDGNGVIDFLQGGLAFTSDDFDLIVDSNLITGLGTIDVVSTVFGDSLIIDPNRVASSSRPEVGVFEFLSNTTFDGSQLLVDIYGNRVAQGNFGDPVNPNENVINIFRDDSFPENGLNQANIEYDQLNVFDRLILDGELEINLALQDGYIPEIGEFYDLVTADQIVLNGSIDLTAPVFNDLTFGYEVLNLLDPIAGSQRDVLRVTYGVAAIPEPHPALILLVIVGLVGTIRVRREQNI